MKNLPNVYCFVREDLSLAQQIVQVGHATLQAGVAFNLIDPTNLIVFSVSDERKLCKVMDFLDRESLIEYTYFYEPESIDPPGITAVCTNQVSQEDSKIFKRFKLWSGKHKESSSQEYVDSW